MVIGLSGKYCSGKNAAASIFEELDLPAIDVDKLGHLALAAEITRIEEVFGSQVIAEEKPQNRSLPLRFVNRRALGSIVFSDPAKLIALEEITHPWMVQEITRRIEEFGRKGHRHVIVNAAILYRMGLHTICESVVWIEAPLCLRIRRALSRDPLKLPAVIKRIYAQRKLKPQPLGKYVDIYKVENRSGIDSLRTEIRDVLDLIEQKGRDGR